MGAWEDGFAAGYVAGLERSARAMGASSESIRRAKKGPRKAKRSRKPTAYNRFMAKELKKLRKKHPRTAQATLFKRAARAWKRKRK